ncbi:hypothetical protein BC628DRAFT_190868 [Trametes gibbosa]|nr:hypothetical protein BC628DRAFT_190868 [Trametes gibbosa]
MRRMTSVGSSSTATASSPASLSSSTSRSFSSSLSSSTPVASTSSFSSSSESSFISTSSSSFMTFNSSSTSVASTTESSGTFSSTITVTIISIPSSIPSTVSSSASVSDSSSSSNSASNSTSSTTLSSTFSGRPSSSFRLSSSRPVLGPTATPSRSTTTVRGATTLFTTVVKTTTFSRDGMTRTSTYTTIVPTGTLIPNGSVSNNDMFKHNKGALAGLIVGLIAFVGIVAAWGFFAYRRHHIHRMQAEAATTALGRSNGGNRAFVLDEDDEDRGGLATQFVGGAPASLPQDGVTVAYDCLRGGNNMESPSNDAVETRPIGDAQGHDDAGRGIVGLAPVPIVGTGEDASLMHPANRSAADVTLPVALDPDAEMGVLPHPRTPRSPPFSVGSRRSSGPGPEPAAWLGGRAASYGSLNHSNAVDPFKTDAVLHTSPSSPTYPSSRSSVYSDEGATTLPSGFDAQLAATAAGALSGAFASRNASMSSHSHGGQVSGSSAHGHAGGGTGSSSGGYGSSSGHKTGNTGSSSGHTRGSAPTSTQGHAPLIGPTAPSSLLPTQTHAPSSYHDVGDEESGRASPNARRMSSFLGRSLRGLRIRSPRQSVASLSGVTSSPTAAAFSPASTAFPVNTSLQQPMHEPPSARPSSFFRPLSPTLGSLPESAFSQVPIISAQSGSGGGGSAFGPYSTTASGAPVWPGLGAALGYPSPALTEGSSVNVPEGLLDPRFAQRPGMQSQGALSFRDDVDYSRPIGGWVNNRQYSRTTIQTVSTYESPRRPSLESHNTQTTGVETVHLRHDEHLLPEPHVES